MEAEGEALEQRKQERLSKLLVLNIFQAVVQHVVVLQSEVALFTAACGGNTGKAMRALSTSTGLVGVLGLVVNQLGGKISDAIGRKLGYVVGPVVNMIAAALVIGKGDSLFVLIASRVLKLIFTTFSGSVVTGASIADALRPKHQMAIGPRINGWVGVAVTGTPFLEAFILKVGGGNPRNTYKALAIISALQLFYVTIALPETLKSRKPLSLDKISDTLAALNPLGFLRIFRGKNAALKQLVSISTFQSCCEGRCTSELFQLWAQNNLKWTNYGIRNLISTWGAVVTVSSLYLQPHLGKKLCARSYTSFCNAGMTCGLAVTGLAPHWTCAYGGLVPIIAGINGGNSVAVKTLAAEISKIEGYGNGEFSAWVTNLRTLVQSFATIVYGQWYAYCQDNGIYAGSAWWLAAVIGGLVPQLMVLASPSSTFDMPAKIKIG